MRRLDPLPLPRVTQRPHGRHGLRGAERHIDPAAAAAAGAFPAQPLARAWVAALHQSDEVRTIHRTASRDPQAVERLLVSEPAAWGLRHLPIRGQVVVPALGLDSLALQVAGIPAAPGRTYARRRHHMGDDREAAGPANGFCTARARPQHPRAYGLLEPGRCASVV